MKKQANILVVDDEPDICFLTKSILKKSGYQNVTVANTVEEAYTLIQANKYEIFFIDLSLNDASGVDVVRYVDNEYEYDPQLNIITGFCSISDRNALNDLGVNSILTKPLTKEKILKAI